MTTNHREDPTVVLVHGAWADGSSWNKVIRELDRFGLRARSAQIPLTSLADDVAALKRLLRQVPGPVVLAGHCYGGAVITAAGAGHHGVMALAYIAAIVPDEGETVGQVFGRATPHPKAPALKPDTDGFFWLDLDAFRDAVAPDAAPEGDGADGRGAKTDRGKMSGRTDGPARLARAAIMVPDRAERSDGCARNPGLHGTANEIGRGDAAGGSCAARVEATGRGRPHRAGRALGCPSNHVAARLLVRSEAMIAWMGRAYRRCCGSAAFAALYAIAAATAAAEEATWVPPKTAWGEPDLQGTWTSDDSIGVPFERPRRYGNRKWLTEAEYAEREKENQLLATSVQAGIIPEAGYWVQHEGVDARPYGSNWTEYARHTSRQTSLIVDPEDGHFPPLTAQGQYKRLAAIAAARKKPRPESWEDLSMFARCISRGVLGSTLPVIYGNGTGILQSPGLVVIRYEMIHEARIIPIDPPDQPRPHLPAGIRSYMGDARGHWDGNTLVIDTTNFIGGRLGIGDNGEGVKYSEDLHLVERFTRTSERAIQYQATVNDPKTFTAPWTVAFPLTHEPGYQIFEYACHEGNYSMANTLNAARAEEKTDTAPK